MKRLVLLVFAVVALMAAGCQALEIGVLTGRGGASIEITVSEEELNTLLADSAGNAENGVSFVPEVQFDNGTVTMNATVTEESGASASGSVSFAVTQEDNQLRIYATNVSVVGTDAAGNEALNLQVALNREVAAQLAGQTGADFEPVPDSIFVDSIEILPGELVVTVRLPG